MGQGEGAVNLVASTYVLYADGEVVQANPNQSLDSQLKKFWDLESVGILSTELPVYDKFVNEISFKGHHYEVRLPWKETHPELPNNFDLSCGRLGNLLS